VLWSNVYKHSRNKAKIRRSSITPIHRLVPPSSLELLSQIIVNMSFLIIIYRVHQNGGAAAFFSANCVSSLALS
jgi:hypothetical protein